MTEAIRFNVHVSIKDGRLEEFEGIANIGVRPTVDGKEPLLEVHIFDFDEDIYGRLLTVTFLKKVRDERTFDGLDSLKKQIEQDIAETRDWFAIGRPEPRREGIL